MKADCANFIHDWQDHYYGIECKKCKLLVPDGCGPWMPAGEVVLTGVKSKPRNVDAAGILQTASSERLPEL